MCAWFSAFSLNALVRRVNRRMGHTHGEVLALGIGRADVHQVGTTLYPAQVNPGAFAGAVAAQRARSYAGIWVTA